MTGIAAASFFSNTCRFGGCGLHFPTLADLIEHIEDNHIDTDPRVLEKQELQQPTYVALSYINRFMTDAARREQESLKKKIQPKLSLTLSSSVSRGNVSTPPRHSSGSLTPPVTPPITPSSSFRSSTPTGSEYDEEEVDYEESDSDESWTTESAISSEAILSSMCMNGGEEKPFACPVPGCKKRYKALKPPTCLLTRLKNLCLKGLMLEEQGWRQGTEGLEPGVQSRLFVLLQITGQPSD
ncbi:juxtaposed with another zinc finger protein 1 isoform X2 [Chlorocebus sabaeus]|uniref:juxtaposed with another zinc finger protein 1 isoform X2 n=1 Tax=Chlorocebus sabaeus TaxID=60711 RepID=UPI00045DC182|nr:juxtaposed with another zinc finger protein 1 isoform X2 [Chlorocebus sabaeus]